MRIWTSCFSLFPHRKLHGRTGARRQELQALRIVLLSISTAIHKGISKPIVQRIMFSKPMPQPRSESNGQVGPFLSFKHQTWMPAVSRAISSEVARDEGPCTGMESKNLRFQVHQFHERVQDMDTWCQYWQLDYNHWTFTKASHRYDIVICLRSERSVGSIFQFSLMDSQRKFWK